MTEFDDIANAPEPQLSEEDKTVLRRVAALLHDESIQAALTLHLMTQGATGDVTRMVAIMLNDIENSLGTGDTAITDDSDVFACGFALGTLLNFMYQMEGAFPEGLLPDKTLIMSIRAGYFRWFSALDDEADSNTELTGN